MLNALRQKAGSWFVKILLMLLVVSFAVWGIGDVFFGGATNPTVATVGGSEISAAELSDGFNRALSDLQQRLGSELDRQQAIRLGLLQQALQDLIARRLVDLRAQDMGIVVADDTLRQMVTGDPVFQTAGQFDRARFEQLLRGSGLNEQSYLASLRQDVVRSTLTGSLAGPVVVPATLVDTLYRYRNEQRRGHYVAVAAASITDPPQPTDDQLLTFHDDHPERFTAPEYRRLTFVTLQPEDLLDEIEIDDARIETEYQARIDDYRTPERRAVSQLLARDRATIEQAAAQLAEGKAFDEVAAAQAGQGMSSDQLGEITKADLPPELAATVFAMAEGEVSPPIESPFGWHLFRVTAILPETVVPLAEARAQLARELALAEARDRLPDVAAQLDDELAAGASLAEAAAVVGVAPGSMAAIDAQGQTAEGVRPAVLPAWPEFLRVAFETPAEETSLLEETEAGTYFVLRVEEALASRVKPVDEVRPQLIEAWQGEQRRELARQRAEDLLARLADGATLAALASAEQRAVTPIPPVKRGAAGDAQGINRAVVRALFETAPGQVADEVVALDDGFAVVATDEVIAADPGVDPEGVERLRVELETDLRNDLLAQFEAELRRAYRVEIDGAALNRVIGADGQVPSGPARPQLPDPGGF